MERFWNYISPQQSDPPPRTPLPPVSAPTVAQLASDAYNSSDAPSEIGGFRRLSAEDLIQRGIAPEAAHTPSGMHANVYEDTHGRAVISYRGTVNPSASLVTVPYDGPSGLDTDMDMMNALRGEEQVLRFSNVMQSARDWVTNLRQGMGLETSQHNDAVILAKQVNTAYGTDNVMLTGHSKGGGEAQLVGAMFGQPTMTFNSAAPHDDTLRRFGLDPDLVRQEAPNHITSLVTRGEAVDLLQGRTFSARPWLDAMVRTGPYGDLLSSEDMPHAQDNLDLRTPIALGRRVDIEPDPQLGSVSRHLMTPGVMPYVDQFSHLSMNTPQRVQENAPEQSPPPSGLLSGFSLVQSQSQLPFLGRFGFGSSLVAQDFLDRLAQARAPSLDDARHPGNALYTQIRETVERDLPDRDAGQRSRIAGALTVEALRNGLDRVDSVAEANGKIFARQGEFRNMGVDVEQALQTTLQQSGREARTANPQQADAPQDQVLRPIDPRSL